MKLIRKCWVMSIKKDMSNREFMASNKRPNHLMPPSILKERYISQLNTFSVSKNGRNSRTLVSRVQLVPIDI